MIRHTEVFLDSVINLTELKAFSSWIPTPLWSMLSLQCSPQGSKTSLKLRAFHSDSGLNSQGSKLIEIMPTNFYGTIDTHLVDIVEILLIPCGLLRTLVKEFLMRDSHFFWSTAVQALWVYPSIPNLPSMD